MATELVITKLEEVRHVQAEVKESLQANQFGDRDQFSVELALEEALVNAIKHGNQLDPAKRVFVRYEILPDPDRFEIRIEDEGPGFDPADVPDPTAIENLERPCGRGLFLIRNFMNDVRYHGRGNVLTMTKLRNGTPD